MSYTPKLSILIPTYQEALNIPLISQQIDEVLRGTCSYEIRFVDDNSQDGSVEAVNELAAKGLPVKMDVRLNERGLSTAVIQGLEQAQGEYVIVMDADLSHPPKAIIPMLEALESNKADFCVGSRYIKGGSFDDSWGFLRLLNSKVATWLAAPLCHFKDPMSGFFGCKRSALPPRELLSPLGYKIGLEIFVKGHFKNVLEIPIHFSDRRFGNSKLNFKEQLKYLQHLTRLYRFKFLTAFEFCLFGLVGSTGFLIDSCLYFLLMFLGLSHEAARGVAFWPAVTWNWFWNRTLTFSHRRKDSKLKQWLSFIGTSSLGFCINFGSYYLLTHHIDFFMQYRYLALITGVLIGMSFNFIAAKLWVFRPFNILKEPV